MINQTFLGRKSADRLTLAREITLRTSEGEIRCDAEIDGSATSASLANAELLTRIDQALRATGYLPLRDMELTAAEGLVILRGRLPSYYMKQVAQEVVRSVPGVIEVFGDLEVVSPRSIPR